VSYHDPRAHIKRTVMTSQTYSSRQEAARIFDLLVSSVDSTALPPEAIAKKTDVEFTCERDLPYFPIPFKETETAAALKAVEGCLAALLAGTKERSPTNPKIHVNLEKTTAFLFQAYLARVGGLGKLDKDVRALLKGAVSMEALREMKLTNDRYGLAPGAVKPIPPHVSQPVRDC
jgi:hypothetical protein